MPYGSARAIPKQGPDCETSAANALRRRLGRQHTLQPIVVELRSISSGRTAFPPKTSIHDMNYAHIPALFLGETHSQPSL